MMAILSRLTGTLNFKLSLIGRVSLELTDDTDDTQTRIWHPLYDLNK